MVVKATKRQPKPRNATIGRPRIELDARQLEQLQALARINASYEEIEAVMGVSVDTLTRRFAEVIKKGRSEGRSSLKRQQMKVALEGNVTMLIWLGKVLLGQSEVVVDATDPSKKRKPQLFRFGAQVLEI